MVGKVEARLAELGIELPVAPEPKGSYVPCRRAGALVHVSGQLPIVGDTAVHGQLGKDVDVATGQSAARLCALNMLAQLRAFGGGSLDAVNGCVQLIGFVNASPDFADHPAVVNGASDLMLELFGESGRHARAAIGVSSLPANVAVEVAGIFELAEG